MIDLLPFIVAGLASGAIFGLAGTGLVLSYRTSGVLNFGYGALATVAVYAFYWLHVTLGLHWILAVLAVIFVVGPVMGLGMEQMARRLALYRTSLKILGTVGLILAVQGFGTLAYGDQNVPIDNFLPGSGDRIKVAGVSFAYSDVVTIAIAVVSVVALSILLRKARIGLAMRAAVDDPDLLSTKGYDPVRVRRSAWILSSTFAAMSGLLVAPALGLDPLRLTFWVVSAFGAAALGLFRSIPLTFAGGLAIGVVAGAATKYEIDYPWLDGVPDALPFVVLVVVLLVVSRRKLAPVATLEPGNRPTWKAPASLQIGGAVVVLVVLWFVPAFAGAKLPIYNTAMAQMMIFLSLGLLVRLSGQVSLCHAVFAAVGASTFAHLLGGGEGGLPWLVALVLAGLVVVPIGAVVAIPAIRLTGVYLALATLGFGIAVQMLVYRRDFMFGELTSGRLVPRPSFAQADDQYYYILLTVVVIIAAGLMALERARLGRLLRALGDSPVGLSVLGLGTKMTRVIVFCISAFIAGIAGALYAGSLQVVTGGEATFDYFNSLLLVVILAIAPFVSLPWYAVAAGAMTVIPAYFESPEAADWLNGIFGLAAVMVSMEGGPRSMPMALRRVFGRLPGLPSIRRRRGARAVGPAGVSIERAKPDGLLEIQDVTVRFGGLVAVDGMTLRAPVGRVTGLIGPNGAGKSTTFNACLGLVRLASGEVRLDGVAVSRLGPAARARRGLGRTFQVPDLFDSLTVGENVLLGREAGFAGINPATQVAASRRQQARTEDAAVSAMELCGVTDLIDRQAGSLTTVERRLVELARCLAGDFHVLLLDEPSAGLDATESRQLAQVLRRVVEERGVGILIVEHDMPLVMSLCEYIYVMDFGQLIAEGTPQEVAASAAVQEAYLGSTSRHDDNPALSGSVEVNR